MPLDGEGREVRALDVPEQAHLAVADDALHAREDDDAGHDRDQDRDEQAAPVMRARMVGRDRCRRS